MKFEGMWIQDVAWENLFSYTNGVIHLANMTLIGGRINGAGKTTVLQAICYGLTGKFLLGVSAESAIHHGTTGFKITMNGLYNDQPFTLIRTFKLPNSKTVTFFLETEGKQEKVPNCQSEILDHIVTYDEFVNLIYVDGHHIERLMSGTEATRSKMLDRIFGIDTLRKIIDAIKINTYTKEYNELEDRKITLQTEKKNIEKILAEMNHLTELIEKQKQLESKKQVLEQEVSLLNSKFEPIYQQYLSQQSNAQKESVLTAKLSLVQEELHKTEDELLQKLTLYNDAEDRIKKLIKTDTPFDYVAKLTNQVDQLTIKQTELRQKYQYYQILDKLVANTSTTINTCPMCIQPITQPITQLRKTPEITQVASELAGVEKQILIFQTALQQYRKASSDLDQSSNALQECQSKYNEHSQKIAQITNILSVLQKDRIDETYVRDMQQVLMKKQNDLLLLNGQMTTLQESITLIQNTKTEYQETALKSLTDQINVLQGQQIKLLERKKVAEILRNNFNQIQSHLRHDMLKIVNPLLQQLLDYMRPILPDAIKPIQYEIQLEIQKVRQEEIYLYHDIVRVYNQQTDYSALSTGQKAICALALLLAISEALHPALSLVTFDEIHTSGIDNDVSNQLLQAITTIASKLHIIFIDRNPKLNDAIFDHTTKKGLKCYLYNAENRNGESLLTQERNQ